MKNRYRVVVFFFLFISISLVTAYLFLPTHFQSLDSRIRDFYFKYRGPQKASDEIVIIDIDEKSIKELGQWPWERDKIAKILQNLTKAEAAIIGLDIIFSEADKTSPKYMAKKWALEDTGLPDYDLILAEVITTSPTILGYVFDFDRVNENEAPQLPAIFVQKHKKSSFIPVAQGVLTNIEIIQDRAYSSGYMNNIPDESGIIRSVPLLIEYEMQLYSSLAFEMYRIALGVSKVTVNYTEAGVESIKLEEQTIKSDRFGRLYVNFRGPFQSYKYISALDIYKNNIDAKVLQNKFILIGTSAYGLMDLRSTPMESVIAGVEIHANILDNLLNNDMLYKPSWIEIIDIIMMLFIAALILFALSRFSLGLFLLLYTSFFFGVIYFYYHMLFTEHIILNLLFPILSLFFSLVVTLGVNYMFELRQKNIIKGKFSKKVSKQVMEDLLSHLESSSLSSREVHSTIYFSDIRSFTSISEKLKSPTRIIEFLNYYMNVMVEVIEKNSGTIDKFIGDAVMAYWNAPLKVKQHADKAVQTALVQITKREEINTTIRKDFGFDVDYGIGINTGTVVVGEVGSYGRSDYTIIGDAVNLASRLEGLCKVYKVRLVVSEFTLNLLEENYVYQLLDIVKVKGKTEPVKIYEVHSQGMANETKLKELEEYNKAHELYMNSQFKEAGALFKRLEEEYQKYLYSMYAGRCKELEVNKIEKFDGVFEFTTK